MTSVTGPHVKVIISSTFRPTLTASSTVLSLARKIHLPKTPLQNFLGEYGKHCHTLDKVGKPEETTLTKAGASDIPLHKKI